MVMNSMLKNFFFIKLLRKSARILGYKIDFLPLTLIDTIESKIEYVTRLSRRAQNIPGAVVECGLGNGVSFAILAKDAYVASKDLYGFDSFEGFPEPVKEDDSHYEIKKGGWGNAEQKAVEQKVKDVVSAEYFEKHVKITPGFFSDTLPKTETGPISFLHLDGDLYQSYMDCYENLYEKVVPGGIILIDEYLNGTEYAKYPGGFKAAAVFFADKEVDICRDMKSGKYYIVKR